MNQIVHTLKKMPKASIDKVRELEAETAKQPQVHIETQHSFHAGMYARTICIPAGVVIVGAFIKIPTILIFAGDAIVYTGEGAQHWKGYFQMNSPKDRKLSFVANQPSFLTMLFVTSATTVEEAEEEFTSEADNLMTRKGLA